MSAPWRPITRTTRFRLPAIGRNYRSLTANDSRFIDAVGQSGHPQSPHYDDFLSDWHAVKHRAMRIERADIEQGAIGRIRLAPR